MRKCLYKTFFTFLPFEALSVIEKELTAAEMRTNNVAHPPRAIRMKRKIKTGIGKEKILSNSSATQS